MVIMKKPIAAITVLIAILSISLPAMSQYYEADTSEIEKLGGPYDRGKNPQYPQYYEGIEAYFNELNQILYLQRLITYIDNQLESQEQLSKEQKDNLTGFINVMRVYIVNKSSVDTDDAAGDETEVSDGSSGSKRERFKPNGLIPENLPSDDLKVFADAIAQYIDNEKITSDALIDHINEQLGTEEEIEDYFKKLNEILNLQRLIITYIDNQLESQEQLSKEQKDNLTGFINVMRVYRVNKSSVDTDDAAGDETEVSDGSSGSKRERFKPNGIIPENLPSDDLKVFADAIAQYIDNEKITSDALIDHINEQLEAEEEKVIIKTNTEAFANVVINYMEEEEKRNIEGLTILTVHDDSSYGKETNGFLNDLANEKNFIHKSIKIPEPDQTIPFKWSIVRTLKPAFIFIRSWGDRYKNVIENYCGYWLSCKSNNW